MADAVVTVEQESNRSIYEQLNKLNARYTCKILVEGVVKRPGRNYGQISSPDSKVYTVRNASIDSKHQHPRNAPGI